MELPVDGGPGTSISSTVNRVKDGPGPHLRQAMGKVGVVLWRATGVSLEVVTYQATNNSAFDLVAS